MYQPSFKELDKMNRKRRKRRRRYHGAELFTVIIIDYILPFIIMLISSVVPLLIAAKNSLVDSIFNPFRFFCILIPLLVVTISIGVFIVEYIESEFHANDWYL